MGKLAGTLLCLLLGSTPAAAAAAVTPPNATATRGATVLNAWLDLIIRDVSSIPSTSVGLEPGTFSSFPASSSSFSASASSSSAAFSPRRVALEAVLAALAAALCVRLLVAAAGSNAVVKQSKSLESFAAAAAAVSLAAVRRLDLVARVVNPLGFGSPVTWLVLLAAKTAALMLLDAMVLAFVRRCVRPANLRFREVYPNVKGLATLQCIDYCYLGVNQVIECVLLVVYCAVISSASAWRPAVVGSGWYLVVAHTSAMFDCAPNGHSSSAASVGVGRGVQRVWGVVRSGDWGRYRALAHPSATLSVIWSLSLCLVAV